MARRTSTTRASKTNASPNADTRICVLHGPEPLVQRLHLESLQTALDTAHGETDIVPFDGKTATLADVLDELRSLTLLQTHKIVLVDQADQFVTAHRAALERYAQSPADQATLVLRSTRWNRGKLDALIEKVGCITKCDQPTPAAAKTWLVQRAPKEHNRKLDPQAAEMLIDRLGCDLQKLDTELAKLALLVDQNQPITHTHVEQTVGRSNDEQAWVVQEALLASLAQQQPSPSSPTHREKPGASAIRKIHELVDQSGQPDVLVAYFIADLVRKLALASQMQRQRVGSMEIAQRFKLWGPRRDLFMRVLNRLNIQQASTMLDRVVESDRRAKSGLGQAVRNLECFCAALAEEVT